MRISLIAAMDENRGIGFQNSLPWRGKVPADMARFKMLTNGNAIVMGRKTFQSIGRALPGRFNIVLTTATDDFPHVVTSNSLPEIIRMAKSFKTGELFIIGGGEVFSLALSFADRMYLTMIDAVFPADTFFPDYYRDEWMTTNERFVAKDEHNFFSMRFLTLDRKQ